MRICVVGATGVLGRHVLPRLQERGHSVRAVVRRAEHLAPLQRQGIEAVRGDILDPRSLEPAVAGCDAALHLATAIPRGAGGDWSRNDRIRRDGTRNLLAAATSAGVRRYVQQSITFLHGDRGTAIVDETATLQPRPGIQSAADMEAQVQASAFEWCILRGGAFYGPGTGREESLRAELQAGTLRLPGDGTAYVSLIHVADMAQAVVLAAESAPAHGVFNVVDDTPVTYATFYSYLAAQEDMPDPEPGGPVVASLACANVHLRETLPWRPAYPSFRSGLAH
jgi:nucleoside-diphosphate-sugar epimerase